MPATILSAANAMQIYYAHPAIAVKKESAEIYVKRLPAVREPVAIQENVFVLLDTLVHLTIYPKVAIFMISATSIRTVSRRRSASKLHADFVNVLMAVVDSNVVRMLYVLQRSIVRRAFVATATSEILATLRLDARDNVQSIPKLVNRTLTVKTDIFARLMLLAKEHASIHVKMWLVEPMKIVNWTKIAIQYASVRKVSSGIPYRLDVKNHPFRIV